MSDFALITDSCCDLPQDFADQLSLTVVPMNFRLRGKEYLNYLDGRELSSQEFFQAIRQGEVCTTSAVNIAAFSHAFASHLQEGRDILCVTLSSSLSSTYSSACAAARDFAEQYPERTIYVVDSLCASMGQGLLLYYAAHKRQEGKDIHQVQKWLEDNKRLLCHWFTMEDLNHLKRGGRISPATALVGSILGIKPLLHVDNQGTLVNVGKVKGRKASLEALVERMRQTAVNPRDQAIFICHGDCLHDAERLAALVRESTNARKIVINSIGPVIGAHSGPGTIAVFFVGTHR